MPPTDTTIIAAGNFLQLCRRGRWEFVERHHCTGAVAVIGVTATEEIILIEQYRAAVDRVVIEFPAGLVGDVHTDEDLRTAAERELLEETGYEAAQLTHLLTGAFSPGLSSELITLFLGTNLKKVGDGGGDGTEDIIVHAVPLATIHDWVRERTAAGMLVDPKLYAGLYLLEQARGK